MKQAVYRIVDERFHSFVVNNQKILDEMEIGEVRPLSHFKHCVPYMDNFGVAYVTKYNGMEGPKYAFLTVPFDKIYTFYDVE
jgi:hypothetical protein